MTLILDQCSLRNCLGEQQAHPDGNSLLPGGTLGWGLGDKGPRDAQPSAYAWDPCPLQTQILSFCPQLWKNRLVINTKPYTMPQVVFFREDITASFREASTVGIYTGSQRSLCFQLGGHRPEGQPWLGVGDETIGILHGTDFQWLLQLGPWGGVAESSPEEVFAKVGPCGHSRQDPPELFCPRSFTGCQ